MKTILLCGVALLALPVSACAEVQTVMPPPGHAAAAQTKKPVKPEAKKPPVKHEAKPVPVTVQPITPEVRQDVAPPVVPPVVEEVAAPPPVPPKSPPPQEVRAAPASPPKKPRTKMDLLIELFAFIGVGTFTYFAGKYGVVPLMGKLSSLYNASVAKAEAIGAAVKSDITAVETAVHPAAAPTAPAAAPAAPAAH